MCNSVRELQQMAYVLTSPGRGLIAADISIGDEPSDYRSRACAECRAPEGVKTNPARVPVARLMLSMLCWYEAALPPGVMRIVRSHVLSVPNACAHAERSPLRERCNLTLRPRQPPPCASHFDLLLSNISSQPWQAFLIIP